MFIRALALLVLKSQITKFNSQYNKNLPPSMELLLQMLPLELQCKSYSELPFMATHCSSKVLQNTIILFAPQLNNVFFSFFLFHLFRFICLIPLTSLQSSPFHFFLVSSSTLAESPTYFPSLITNPSSLPSC